MSLSVVLILIWAFLLIAAIFLPYNSVRDIAFSLTPPALILTAVYLVDYSLDFVIIPAIGQAFAALLGDSLSTVVVSTNSMYTAVGFIVLFVVFLLVWGSLAIIISKCTTGAAPWKQDGTRPLKHVCCSVVFLVAGSFLAALGLAGTRSIFYIQSGFLDDLFSTLIPWEVLS